MDQPDKEKNDDQIKFMVETPFERFGGRRIPLRKLKETVQSGKKRIALIGHHGMGKTELAKKHLEDETKGFQYAIWIKAHRFESLIVYFRRLAFEKLGIEPKRPDGMPKDIQTVLKEVHEFLADKACIIVFDHATHIKDGVGGNGSLEMFLEAVPPNAVLLLTSTERNWDGFHPFPVGIYNLEDARQVMYMSINQEIMYTYDQSQILFDELRFYPLALHFAHSYLKVRAVRDGLFGKMFEIKEYVDLYKERYEALKDVEVVEFDPKQTYVRMVMVVTDMTIKQVLIGKQPSLPKMAFEMMTYYTQDMMIAKDIVNSMPPNTQEKMECALLPLEKYQLIGLYSGYMSLNKLVQEASWRTFKGDEEKLALERIFNAAETVEADNLASAWEHAQKHPDIVDKFSNIPNEILKKLVDDFTCDEDLIIQGLGKIVIKS